MVFISEPRGCKSSRSELPVLLNQIQIQQMEMELMRFLLFKHSTSGVFIELHWRCLKHQSAEKGQRQQPEERQGNLSDIWRKRTIPNK